MSRLPEASNQDSNGVRSAPVSLEPHEYKLWEGDWYDESMYFLEDNIYSRLAIGAPESGGFEYQFEYRDVPYGPNATWSEMQRALFDSPRLATDPATGQMFSLLANSADRHGRVIVVTGGTEGELGWSPIRMGPVQGRFVPRRQVNRPGFDCQEASSAIETAICRDELLALADSEMNTLYSELMSRSESPESKNSLRSSQRSWLRERDSTCVKGEHSDSACIARLYSDRLVALSRIRDPSLGSAPRFDAGFAMALLNRGSDLRRNTAAQLAMYPLKMKPDGAASAVDWRTDASGILLEQTYVETLIVWSEEFEFRFSDMFFVGTDGLVWAASHFDLAPWPNDLKALDTLSLELHTGRKALEIWPEKQGAQPDFVRAWLEEHPVRPQTD